MSSQDKTQRRSSERRSPERRYAKPDTGFAWLRMIGATIVVVEHCFPLVNPSRTSMLPENWHLSLGYFALMGFFAMSGYQISDSWRRDSSWWRFVLKRVLRIWPPLLFVVLCTAFVIGPLVTLVSPHEYWSNPTTWGYVVHNAELYPLQHILPGVFGQNPYPWSVNGSLWTLPMETTGYVVVLLAGIVGGLASGRFLLFPLLAAFMVLDGFGQASVGSQGDLGALFSVPVGSMAAFLVPFVLGMLLHSYAGKIPFHPLVAYTLVALYLVANFTPPVEPAARYLLPIAAGYGAVTWALHWPRRLGGHEQWVYGSYGMYVWGMPVQQLWVLAGVRNSFLLIALAVPASYLCGCVSWRLIERPTQLLRIYLRPKRASAPAATPPRPANARHEPVNRVPDNRVPDSRIPVSAGSLFEETQQMPAVEAGWERKREPEAGYRGGPL
jgi:peptidoglycan/LPS O-acetylase OafA/YrhL